MNGGARASSKRVAVIGAGPSGLVTVKELLAEGHEPTCFEKSGGLGGVFRFGEDDGIVWDSCRLTSSGALTAFSDFPVPADHVEHMAASEYADYLRRYADTFGVSPRIRLGTTVVAVTASAQGGWTVRSVDRHGVKVETYDAVAVCSGLNQHPSRPTLPGQETFAGTILHSSRYRRPAVVAGKRVLVAGGGESGADIVAEVSEQATETVLSLRRGVAVVRRRFRGLPNDYRLSRITHSAAPWITLTSHPRDDGKRRLYHAVFMPCALFDKGARAWTSGLDLLHALPRRAPRAAVNELRTRLRCRAIIARLLRESGGGVLEQFGTKSDEFVRALASGRCRQVGAIARFDGDRVVFEDGSTFEPDIVILCTGFEAKAPFLDDALVKGDRFLHMIDPAIGPGLAFIGFVRPAHGAIPPVSELQARYLARLLSGSAELPDEREMRASMARIADTRQFGFRAVRERLAWLVDYTSFCDEIAARIGCKPSREAIRRERPGFRLRFFTAPFVSAQYRLVGPHARPDIARQVIGGLPIAHPIAMLAAFYLRWTLSRVLHRLLGEEFAPKLRLP